jgi:hypothetical protein
MKRRTASALLWLTFPAATNAFSAIVPAQKISKKFKYFLGSYFAQINDNRTIIGILSD